VDEGDTADIGPAAGELPRVGIVVVNWCRRDATLACLRALADLDYPARRLVLVDNGCRDFSAAELDLLAPASEYVRSDRNLGFAGGSNLGMRRALAGGVRYVWFLNNDAEPEPRALRESIAVAEGAARPAIVGAKILLKDRPDRIDSVALRLDLCSGRVFLRGHDEKDRGQYDAVGEVDAVTGCAMLVAASACERLGGFDESFFSYLEDADLCLRARAIGLRVAAAPRARVLHDRPVATRGRQSTASLYYATRNHLRLVRRHGKGSAPTRWLRPILVVALNLAYALRAGGGRAAAPRLAAVLRGARDHARGVSGEGAGVGRRVTGDQGPVAEERRDR
jgi:GT2 family glycosyltransferase